MQKSIRVLFGLAALAGVFSFVRPAAAMEEEAKPTIKCEKCTCNLGTGICDCTNCTIVQS
jgi:hypothetical protein